MFHIYTALWGSHYINLFKRACWRSLNWPKNKAAIEGAVWNIYTSKEHFEELTNLFKDSGFQLQLFAIEESIRMPGVGMVPTSQCDAGVILLSGLRAEVAYAIRNKSKMLLAPPDTIFGDGSVSSLIEIGQGAGRCVAVAHPRVLSSILDDIDVLGATRGSLSNAQLVTLASKHQHDSWKYAEIGHPKNNSYVSGVAWKKLSPDMCVVTHRIPTVYYADFNNVDFDFFWCQTSFGAWDHRWPGEAHVRFERQRYVGSSDAAFIVEVTDWDKNVPPELPQDFRAQLNQTGQIDPFWTNNLHNNYNRQVSVIFRGE